MCQCGVSMAKYSENIAVVKTKIELDSNTDTCVLGHLCLVTHDHNKPVNDFGYDPKQWSNHTYIVDATVVYDEPKMGQEFILLIHQVTEM